MIKIDDYRDLGEVKEALRTPCNVSGYDWVFLTADIEHKCGECIRENFRDVVASLKAGWSFDEWRPVEIRNTITSEGQWTCGHCGKEL
jgi:hypothetical protein